MLIPTNIPFDEIGAITSLAPLSVTDSSVQSYTVTAGKKVVILQIVSGGECWYGGATVNPATNIGIIMMPRGMLIFRNVKSTFKIYFRCATGLTAEVAINEAD